MKLLIIGHARHGKDTLAKCLAERCDLTYSDSSRFAAERFMFDKLAPKYGYQSIEQCWEDRVNHRAEWHDEIVAYNTPDPTRLAREMLENHDIYVGMRSQRELNACMRDGVFDEYVWVTAGKRLPPEPSDSMDIDPETVPGLLVVDNNQSEYDLHLKVDWWLAGYLNAKYLEPKLVPLA